MPTSSPTGCAREARTTPARGERSGSLRERRPGAYDHWRARLTLERDDLRAQVNGAVPRACVAATCAPDAGCSRRRRASATFPVLCPPSRKGQELTFPLRQLKLDAVERDGLPAIDDLAA